jgi:pyruvate dehydrogenase E2 component (dihydrolipoamide acetyltransferase)
MIEGKIIALHVKVGDTVKKGDVLMEYETEKMVGEVSSITDGVILELYVKEGDSIEVQGQLCLIGQKGEKPPPASVEPPSGTVTADREKEKVLTISKGERILASPLAKKMAKDLGVDLDMIKGSGAGGRIEKKDVEAATANTDVKSTPLAKKTAAAEGISLDGIHGSGAHGRIQSVDVELTIAAGKTPSAGGIEPYMEASRRPMSNMRKVIARRLSMSKRELPHVYYRQEIDAASILGAKTAFADSARRKFAVKISLNDIILKAVTQALIEYPGVNARIDEDDILYYRHVNLGMAVGVEDGLIVPVIHGADQMSVFDIAKSSAGLIKKAHEGTLQPDDCAGGTFTVSNLGMFGLDEFCPVINPPEAAVLGVGAVRKRVMWKDGTCVPVDVMILTLSADHRLIDGILAACFMKRLRELLENAYALMI